VEGVRDLWGSVDLRGRNWSHADLSGMWLDGSDLTGANLFGARCVGTSFARCNLKHANLAYARIEGASFRQADLEGTDLLYTDIKRARFDGAMIGPTSTIPGVYAGARREWCCLANAYSTWDSRDWEPGIRVTPGPAHRSRPCSGRERKAANRPE